MAKPMRTWGDLNFALNGLVRSGAIGGFQTNREEAQQRGNNPEITIKAGTSADLADALQQVRGTLSGIFQDAIIRTEEPSSPSE